MPYSSQFQELQPQKIRRLGVFDSQGALSFQQVLELLQEKQDFRSFFLSLLRQTSWEAFRWELPPLNQHSLVNDFECVLIHSPELARPADPKPFSDKFSEAPFGDSIAVFSNLGGDAWMIVPRPLESAQDYAHLARFLETAPETQQHSLLICTASALLERLGSQPVWLNTAGAGVAWLHIRLDSRPKYYRYQPYRESPGR